MSDSSNRLGKSSASSGNIHATKSQDQDKSNTTVPHTSENQDAISVKSPEKNILQDRKVSIKKRFVTYLNQHRLFSKFSSVGYLAIIAAIVLGATSIVVPYIVAVVAVAGLTLAVCNITYLIAKGDLISIDIHDFENLKNNEQNLKYLTYKDTVSISGHAILGYRQRDFINILHNSSALIINESLTVYNSFLKDRSNILNNITFCNSFNFLSATVEEMEYHEDGRFSDFPFDTVNKWAKSSNSPYVVQIRYDGDVITDEELKMFTSNLDDNVYLIINRDDFYGSEVLKNKNLPFITLEDATILWGVTTSSDMNKYFDKIKDLEFSDEEKYVICSYLQLMYRTSCLKISRSSSSSDLFASYSENIDLFEITKTAADTFFEELCNLKNNKEQKVFVTDIINLSDKLFDFSIQEAEGFTQLLSESALIIFRQLVEEDIKNEQTMKGWVLNSQ